MLCLLLLAAGADGADYHDRVGAYAGSSSFESVFVLTPDPSATSVSLRIPYPPDVLLSGEYVQTASLSIASAPAWSHVDTFETEGYMWIRWNTAQVITFHYELDFSRSVSLTGLTPWSGDYAGDPWCADTPNIPVSSWISTANSIYASLDSNDLCGDWGFEQKATAYTLDALGPLSDCDDKTNLLAALSRARGNPASYTFGVVAGGTVPVGGGYYYQSDAGFHSWTSIWVDDDPGQGEGWWDVDAALGCATPLPMFCLVGRYLDMAYGGIATYSPPPASFPGFSCYYPLLGNSGSIAGPAFAGAWPHPYAYHVGAQRFAITKCDGSAWSPYTGVQNGEELKPKAVVRLLSNPAQGEARFEVTAGSEHVISIYDVRGRLVGKLTSPRGTSLSVWRPEDLVGSSAVYFYRVDSDRTASGKLVFIR